MIKYHQNGIGGYGEYGEDHQLTNNWNPDLDYGNEYANTHIRIEAKGYGYPSFSFSEEDRAEFYDTVLEVFEGLGWKVDRMGGAGFCMDISKGKQTLYLHPQDFSGELLKNDIKKIVEALSGHDCFSVRWVDLYDTVYDISDDDYAAFLETKRAEIRKYLFEHCGTKRVNQFYRLYDVKVSAANKYKLRRINKDEGYNHCGQQTLNFVQGVIDSMISERLLIYAENNGYSLVRSPNKTEQKKFKLCEKVVDK